MLRRPGWYGMVWTQWVTMNSFLDMLAAPAAWQQPLTQRLLLPPTKEEVNAFACVCLSVSLSVCLSVSKITQKCVHGFGWNVVSRQMSGHGRTDQLLSPIPITVRMPEPDCFLWYRMCCNMEFYYVGKIPRTGVGRPSLQRGVVLKWFYSPRAVGTPLSEVHALYRVPF